MESDTIKWSSPIKRYPWRRCLTCGQRTRRVDQICEQHARSRDKACEACGAVLAEARVNRRFCAPCRLERARKSAAATRGGGPARPEPNHPCLACGENVPTRAARCKPCTAQYKAARLRLRRRVAPAHGVPPVEPLQEWKKRRGYPCARCRHGVPSSAAESGWECRLMLAGRCKPWGEAMLMEAKQ